MGRRVNLSGLPMWAQDLIFRMATGLLDDLNAYAKCMESGNGFLIKAHGFTHAAQKGAERVH